MRRRLAGVARVSRASRSSVQEDGAAQPRHRRGVVVAEDDDRVVEPVMAAQGLGAGGGRAGAGGQAHRPVIGRIAGRIAPAVAQADGARGQGGCRARAAVGAVEDAAQRPGAGGRRAVALALVVHDAASPQRAGAHRIACANQPPMRLGPVLPDDEFHGRSISEKHCRRSAGLTGPCRRGGRSRARPRGSAAPAARRAARRRGRPGR